MGDVIYQESRLHHPHLDELIDYITHAWIGQCANSKLVTDTGSHVTLRIHLMYSMPTFDTLSSIINSCYYCILQQLMDQLEDSQQHFDKIVQAALSDALFSASYIPNNALIFFHKKKAILILTVASQSDLAFHHNMYMTPQCVNIRYPIRNALHPLFQRFCKTLYI